MSDEGRPARGTFSRLLAELAAAPRREQQAAWDRGFDPGTLVAERYELESPLGRGGFGVVFRARDRKLRRAVAFKLVPPAASPDPVVQQEAEVAAQLEHANVVRLYDYGLCTSGAYLVFELLRGQTLAERLARGPIPRAQAVRITADLARGIAHAHRHGVLHRDLKPANVFLTEDGEAKLLDFGLAYYFGTGPRRSGTPGYMAPEQVRGDPEDARTDVFALGVVLREMLGGAGQPLPADLAALVERATHADPDRRPREVEALANELDRIERTVGAQAYSAYARGVACADRPAHGEDCGAHFRRALELDPGFARAAWRLSIWAHWNGRPRAEVREALARAERAAGTAHEPDGTLITAWAAHLDGRDDAALTLLGDVERRWPGEQLAFYQAGDILRHRDENAAALPHLERAVALAPDDGWALGSLVHVLGALGRLDDLRDRAARWEEEPGPGTLHALSLARGWLGDVEAAARAARQSDRAGGGLPAREDLLAAEVFGGRGEAVRPEIEGLAAAGSPARRLGFYGLAALEAFRGQPRAGLAHLDALDAAVPEASSDAVHHGVRADYLAGLGDLAGVREAVKAARAINPVLAAEHAITLAWLGDAAGAEELARDLPAGRPLARATEAVLRLRRGDANGIADLAGVAAGTPVLVWRVAPLFLLGLALVDAGRHAEALDALGRATRLYVPLAIWRCWALPRARLGSAVALARLGRYAEAAAAAAALRSTAPDPEPGCGWALEAAALAARLAR